jgi:hypothetical protein
MDRRRILTLALTLGSTSWGAGCTTDGMIDGGNPVDSGPMDAGTDAGPPDAGFIPAADPPQAQVPYGGGPLLSQVAIVTVTWAGDPLASQLRAFDLWLPGSTYWSDSLEEYGIQPGTQVGVLGLDAGVPATLSDAEIQALLIAAIDGGEIPSPSPGLISAVYPPPGTLVAETYSGVTYHGCVDFTGYHSFVPLPGDGGDGGFLVYTVVPRCPTSGVTDLEATSWASSHEIAEAATDPFALSGVALPGWALPVGPDTPNGGELADLCENNPRSVEGNLVAALYSNRAADAGARPCVPSLAGPMFGAVATPNPLILQPGTSSPVSLLVYSSAPLSAPLTLKLIPYDPAAITAFASSALAENGDQVTVTVNLSAGVPSGYSFTLEVLLTSADGYRNSTFVAIQAN